MPPTSLQTETYTTDLARYSCQTAHLNEQFKCMILVVLLTR